MSTLRHRIIGIWLYGIHTEQFQFKAQETGKIITFLQATNEKYANRQSAHSFVYRTIKKYKESAQTPHLLPFRDRRGENRQSPKRKNTQIIEICDEMLSEPKATAKKVCREVLLRLRIAVSPATIYRIGADLFYHWTKPWYTDILTPAQKFKRFIFCEENLQLTEEELLRKIAAWMFSDEKWWDIVGPAMSSYVKAATKVEAKNKNKVKFACMFAYFLLFFTTAVCLCLSNRGIRAKKVG